MFEHTSPDNPSPTYSEHGNECAGIIAAEHNNEGIAGIAPNCKIMPIKLPENFYPVITLSSSILFAANNKSDVISCSWGFNSTHTHLIPSIVSAIRYATTHGRDEKGCIVLFAAGNSANRVDGNKGYVVFPANCGNEKMIVVGASDRNDNIANYSPSSSQITVVAPSHRAYTKQIEDEGLDVWTIDTEDTLGSNPKNGETLPNVGQNYLAYTGRFGGTSAACPQVAAVAALMLSLQPMLSAQQVKNIISSTARMPNNGILNSSTRNNDFGYGVVNASNAILYVYNLGNSDLYIKDDANDMGIEPNLGVSSYHAAPEIKILYNNEEVSSMNASVNYEVEIAVHNRDSIASVAGKTLKVYFTYQKSNMSWPDAWIDELQTGEQVMGTLPGLIDSCTLPSINASDSIHIHISWTAPHVAEPANAFPINPYFTFGISLLAVLEDGNPTIGIDEIGYDIDSLVANNNNVARRDLTVKQAYSVVPPIVPPLVSPNPTSTQATVGYQLPEGVEQATLTVVGGNGNILKSLPIEASTTSVTFDVQDLPMGQYLVQISVGDAPIADSKLLIVR